MDTLTRRELIEQLRSAMQGQLDSAALAAWAFDCFYAAEQAHLLLEPGYGRIIRGTLDELMFGDAPGFGLTHDDLQRLVLTIERAEPQPDDQDDEDNEDDDADE